ncbi:MAG: prepilin-type N-terminal cleavage/methylation domain-containing protein [bacterium]|nr:prepilin-type N-terminal cleavage/methylation domain-containing protein [bacterium]
MKKGITLIELLIAVVIVAIGLVAIVSFLYVSWKDWYINKGIKELQEDMDVAGLNIKAILEEANYYEIQDIITGSSPPTGRQIYTRYTQNGVNIWEKKFYRSENKLIMQDIKNGSSYPVINTLQDIKFSDVNLQDTGLTNTINVELTVSKFGKNFTNRFSVKVRNR